MIIRVLKVLAITAFCSLGFAALTHALSYGEIYQAQTQGTVLGASASTVTVYLTSGTSWTGAVTDGSNITVSAIGGGGGSSGNYGSGGGGGEYCKSSVAYTSGTTVNGIQIGQGGSTGIFGVNGTATIWNGGVVQANGGSGANNTGPGAGGAGGTGTICYNGGAGGYTVDYGSGGGGGAGGSNGIGGKGGKGAAYGGGGGGGSGGGTQGIDGVYAMPYNSGTNGGSNSNGTGYGGGDTAGSGAVAGSNGGGGGGGYSSGSSVTPGANGGNGTEWDASHGSGGGGGGGGYGTGANQVTGGNGGLYGGGGGAGSYYSTLGGNGANGIIAITYTLPSGAPTPTPTVAPSVTPTPVPSAPVISAISASGISSSSATINWTTNTNSDSQVLYGLTTGYGSSSVLNSIQTTSHSVSLSGLFAVTLYHFVVQSRDAVGNLSVSSDQTFTTSAIATPTPTPAPTPVPPSGGTQILEDWNCGSGATLTAGNPTIVTCPEPHNFTPGTRVSVWNASGGSWTNINTQWIAFLRLNINPSSTQLLVNDTLYFPQTGNFVVSLNIAEQMLVNVANSDTLNIVQRGYNGTTPSSYALESEVIGPPSQPASYPITILNSTQFSIPFDSTGYGAYAGNPIKIQRESFTYTSTPAQLPGMSIGDGVGQLGGQIEPDHTWDIVLPGCISPSSANQAGAFECAKAFNDPGNQKGYGAYGQVSSLVVSNGIGTVNLVTPFTYLAGAGGRTPGPNQLIWLEGINEGSNAFNSINRPWIMSAINAAATQVTIPGMGGQGVADGTYTITNTSPWFTNNFVLEDPLSLYWFLEGDVSNGSNFPSGYTQQLLKAGPSFNPLDNRVSMYICWGKNFTPLANNTGNLELGNYFNPQPSGVGEDHGYQSLNISGYANQCGLYTFTADSTHFVGQSDPVYNPNDPSFGPVWAPSAGWTGENTHHYWELVSRWYLNGSGLYSDFSNQTVKIGQMTMNYAPNEPEEYIISRGLIYTGSAYQITVETNQPGIAAPSYQFRYSTSDMKVTGFSSGLCQNGTTSCSSADSLMADNTGLSNFLHYTSASLPEPSPTIYWGIRPTIPVSGATGNGVSPIWLTTDYNPNMQIGDHITVAGLTGNTAANQTNAAITGIFPRTYWYLTNPSPTWPAGATPGQLTNIVSNGSSCTVNLTVAHGIQPGWRVVVYSTVTGDATHGYRYTVTSTPTPDSFVYACPGSVSGTYASDTSGFYHMFVTAEPGMSIAGTGNGNWSGETTATVVATDDTKNFAEIAFSPPGASGSIPNPTPTPTPVPTPTPNPVISNLVGSNTTASTTTISWNTDQLTNGQILYGLTSSYTFQSVVVDTNPQTTSHAILFSNLSPSTTYHFSAKSTNSTGQTSQTGDFSFTTLSAPAPTPSPTPSGSPTPTPTGSPTPTGTPVPTPSPTPTPIPVPTTAPAPSGGGGGGGGSPSNPPSPSGGGGGSSSPVVVYIPPSTSTPASPSSPSSSTTRLINIKGTYYLEDNGQLRGITNPGMLASYGFTFAEAQTPTAQDLTLPKGNLLSPGDGSLVKSSQDPTVYLISNQTRYAFTSAKVFSSLGFKFSSVLIVTNPELQILPKGPDISSPASQHLPGTDINNKGTIYWIGQDNQLHGYPSLTTYNSWHIQNDFSTVVPADSADLGLPVGGSVEERVVG